MALDAADEMQIALRPQFIREAVQAATAISISSPEALRGMLGSIEGMLRLAWASLRIGGNDSLVANPKAGMTREDLERFIGTDLKALTAIGEEILKVSFAPDEPEEDTDDPPADAGASASAGSDQ